MEQKMREKVKPLLTKYHLLFENIFSLVTIRGIEYILSFITFPYLVRVLGPGLFGSIVFAQGIIQYFSLFTDYGFNLTGPREIAKHDSKEKRGKIFAAILGAKIFLLIIATIIFCVMCFLFANYSAYDVKLFLVIYISVIGGVFFPVWFFQGIQQMRYITMVNTVARLVSVIGIFCLVKVQEDYIWVAFLQAIPGVVAAVISLFILRANYPETLCLSSVAEIKDTLKNSWDVFTSTIAINAYTASNIVILGFMTNSVIVGYFSGAQKIINCIQRIMSPISQAIYPHISKLVDQDKCAAIRFIKKILVVLGGGNLILSLILLIFATPIVHLLLGTKFDQSILMLRIMAMLPFIISLSNVFGIQTMMPFGMQKQFSHILIASAILNTCIVFPLIYLFSGNGVCMAMLVTECFVTGSMWLTLRKHSIF
jgi:PST family polysaccharide transporter